jgi:hypothetical protein
MIIDNGYYEYTTISGDTWDSISLDFYNDEHYTSELMNANPQYITTLVFDEGTTLKIPIIETPTPSTLPPWKQV